MRVWVCTFDSMLLDILPALKQEAEFDGYDFQLALVLRLLSNSKL